MSPYVPIAGAFNPGGSDQGVSGPGINNGQLNPMSSIGLNFGGMHMNYQNQGMMDPNAVNPYASQYLKQNQALYGQFSESAAGGAFNPNFYNQMRESQQQNMTTALGNQYARMGLSGSSAEMGGMASAIQQNQMNWMNRQQADQMRALQGLEGLNKQGYNMTMGIQNEYGSYQDALLQSLVSAYAAELGGKAAEAQGKGNMYGGALGGLGSLAGGLYSGGAFGGGGGGGMGGEEIAGSFGGFGSMV